MSRQSEGVATCTFCGFRLPYPVRGDDTRVLRALDRHPEHRCIPAWRRALRRLVPVMLRK